MREQGDAERGVARLEHRDILCGIVDEIMVTLLEPRRADDDRRFGGDTGIERRFERARRGEIDEHVRGGRQLGDIAALVDAAAALPRLGDGGGKCDAHPPFAADNADAGHMPSPDYGLPLRSEEPTSELQSLMRI